MAGKQELLEYLKQRALNAGKRYLENEWAEKLPGDVEAVRN